MSCPRFEKLCQEKQIAVAQAGGDKLGWIETSGLDINNSPPYLGKSVNIGGTSLSRPTILSATMPELKRLIDGNETKMRGRNKFVKSRISI